MLRLSDAGDGEGGAAACSEVSRERLSELARERLPEPAEAEDRDPAPAVEPSARMLFELSEARRPVNLKERVKDRVSSSFRRRFRGRGWFRLRQNLWCRWWSSSGRLNAC